MIPYIIAGVAILGMFVMGLILAQKQGAVSKAASHFTTVVNDMARGNYNVNLRSGGLSPMGQLETALARLADIQKKKAAEVATVTHSTTDTSEYEYEIANLKKEVSAVSKDIESVVDAISEGRLTYRIDGFNLSATALQLNEIMDTVSEPVSEVYTIIKNLTKGDFSRTIKGSYKGEFAKLKDSTNDALRLVESYVEEISMVSGVLGEYKDIVEDLKQAAEAIDEDAGQIMNSSQRLSQEANKQSTMVQDLNIALTSVNTQATQTAENAEKAANLASDAMQNASAGQSEMNNMLDAIAGIRESSENISRVINVINDIARQTNLLALNAAVEAARAGAHGKGFMVVAEEVRNLANKSKQAANQTTDLIADSIEKVNQGTETARNTAAALERVTESVREINQIVSNISQVADGQRTAITQLADDTDRIADVARLTAETVDGTVSTVEDLDGQLEVLRHLSDSFVLGGDGRKRTPPPPRVKTAKATHSPSTIKQLSSTQTGHSPLVSLGATGGVNFTKPTGTTPLPLAHVGKTSAPSGSHEYDRRDFGKY